MFGYLLEAPSWGTSNENPQQIGEQDKIIP